jgi:wyosine [tRNA(Phe)-imidazoG37] synthetase (radical SAM superfamily)
MNFKYIYGPVPSWRLGSSLGIDPLSQEVKVCSFNCIYCQLGDTTELSLERKIYVDVDLLMKELKALPPLDIDYITFSGRGEPTLAKNLKDMIKMVKQVRREPIAILTNSSLLYDEEVKEALMEVDFVIAKLDAVSEESLQRINRPHPEINFKTLLDSIKQFRASYKGRFGIQVMFLEENKEEAPAIAEIVKEIGPDEVQLNTPLRRCKVSALSREQMEEIKGYFKGMNIKTVYEVERKEVKPMDQIQTARRRGESK